MSTEKRTVVPLPSAGDARLTLGAVRARLEAAGYSAVSAVMGWMAGDDDRGFAFEPPSWFFADHPPAIRCSGGPHKLMTLALRPIEDQELSDRARRQLERAGLTAGPRHVAADGTATWLLHYVGERSRELGALGRAVTFTHAPHQLIPLDPALFAALLETPAAELPRIDDAQIEALLQEIEQLPAALAQERMPPPKPRKSAWLGR